MTPQDARWDDLRVFLAIARQGSLNDAARALGVNHSTVYRRLNALEADLQARLFEREGAGAYTLTLAGEAALAQAEQMEEAWLALLRGVAGVDAWPAGTVRVTTAVALLPLLAPHIAAFREHLPSITVELLADERLFDLHRLEADVAIRPVLQAPERAVGRRLGAVAWAVYGPAALPADHPLPWAEFGEPMTTRPVAEALAAHIPAQREVALTVNSVPAMRALLDAGGLQGMLPAFSGDASPHLRRRCAPIDAGSLWVLIHPDLRATARVRAFVDFITERLRAELPAIAGQTPRQIAP